MKKKLREALSDAFAAIAQTFARFPLALIILAVLAALTIYRIRTPYEQLKTLEMLLDRITAVLALGVPVSLSVHMLQERLWPKGALILRLLFFMVTAGLLVLYFLFLLPELGRTEGIRLLLLTAAAALVFLAIPYAFKRECFEVYIARLLTRGIMTFFFALVLGAGLSAIFFAVRALLFSALTEHIFAYSWIFVFLIFAPVHFLYDLPQSDEELDSAKYSKVLKVLLINIILPLITAYTAVLYAYFIRIVFSWEWPAGLVSYLVVAYASVGLAAVFMVRPYRDEIKWADLFSRWYLRLLYPLLAMMFLSIGFRIGQYGITENRYFIVIIGIWSFLAALFMLIWKGRYGAVLPVSLALTAVIAVAGPLNAFTLSIRSQNQRLERILTANGMLTGGRIQPGIGVREADQRQINEVITYFEQYHALEDIAVLPDTFTMEQFETVFGFEQKRHAFHPPRDQDHFYLGGEMAPVQITGYDYYIPITASIRPGAMEEDIRIQHGSAELLLDDQALLTILRGGQIVHEIDLKAYILDFNTSTRDGEPWDRALVVQEETEIVRLSIHFTAIGGTFDRETDSLTLDILQANLFIGFKD